LDSRYDGKFGVREVLMGWGIIAGIGSMILGKVLEGDPAGDAMDAQNAANAASAAENAKISRYDASVAKRSAKNITISGNHDLALKVNQIKRLKAQTKSGFAGRGVAVNTGSALNQQESTMKAIQNDMKTIAYNTRKQQMKALSAAERYEMLAAAGLRGAADQAQAYEEAAKAKDRNAWTETMVNAATTIADYYQKGAFDDMFTSTINPGVTAGTTSFMASGSAAPAGYHWGAKN
jgi:hypothetical protein